MSEHWGRSEAAGLWPNRRPVWTLALLLVAIVTGAAVGIHDYRRTWTPLQRVYVSAFIKSAFGSLLGAKGHYHLLEVSDGPQQPARLALDEEVRRVTTDAGQDAFTLSESGAAAGDRDLGWREVSYDPAALHRLLSQWICRDQSLTDLAFPSASTALFVFGLGLFVAIPRDAARQFTQRVGRRLKGPELVSTGAFNRRVRGDGVGFLQRPSLIARLLGRQTSVRIQRQLESSHLLLMGDTGTGKSALIRQLLEQIAARGDTAIVYDPALEFAPQFYNPARGDVILNPLDARSPFWSPATKCATTPRRSRSRRRSSPTASTRTPSSPDAPRRIFAHLLTFHPSPQTLVEWLCDEDELDRRLAGTPYAKMIDRQAPQQRTRRARLAEHGGRRAEALAGAGVDAMERRELGHRIEGAGSFSRARRKRASGSSRSPVSGWIRWCSA